MTAKRKEEYPEAGEFVIGTVKSIFRQGAFIDLDEYPGKRGMLHLSEISLKWVKNIRDYVKEGQKVVLVVLKTNPSRGHIDLSLRRVADSKRKEKLQEVKQRQRAEKLVEIVATEIGEDKAKMLTTLDELFNEDYESIYLGFEAISSDPAAAKKIGFPEAWEKELIETIKKNIKIPYVQIKGYVSLKSNEPDGVDIISESLKQIVETKGKAEIKVSYTSPPLYRVNVKAKTYKQAEM